MKGKECINKKRFKDRVSAQNEADRINKRTVKMRVYQCNLCSAFHLTSVSKNRFKKLQKRELPEKLVNESDYWMKKLTN
jgi:hypothetical protein